jgi:hypothetical protein
MNSRHLLPGPHMYHSHTLDYEGVGTMGTLDVS